MPVQINEVVESGTGEEERLLQEMIDDRDRKITQLTNSAEVCDAKICRIRETLQQTRTDAATTRIHQIQREDNLQKQKQELSKQISILEKNILQQSGGIHVYANLLKEASRESADSTYIIRMQSQLCKAMHSMGIMDHQLDIVNKYSHTTQGLLKTTMAQLTEEKSMVEMSLLNDLMQVDNMKRRMEEGIRRSKEQLEESQRIFHLSQSFDSKTFIQDDESDNEIDEDLLLEILNERKEDIEIMEKEIQAQRNMIQELKVKIEEYTQTKP
jgi:hypothetical protein